jgi:hypothetical protein
METNMLIPVWVKILTLTLSVLAVFVLATRELVVRWLGSVARLLLSKPQRTTKVTSKEEIKLGRQAFAKPV